MKPRYSPPHVEGASYCQFPPDVSARKGDYQPGDFILTHGNAFFSYLIRLGQTFRFFGKNRKYTWWNHAALIVSPEGDIIEAVGAGVRRSTITHYAPTDYTVVRLGTLATDTDRQQVVAYAEWAIGQRYGIMTLISIAVSLLTGCKFTFGFDGQSICSGLVARALERTSVIFDRSPSHIMPADLAKYFTVERPKRGASRGRIPRRQD
jgi:uncharacterized protein YycO